MNTLPTLDPNLKRGVNGLQNVILIQGKDNAVVAPLLKVHKHNDAHNDIIQSINRAPPNAGAYVSCHARMEKPMMLTNAKGAVKIINALSDGSNLWRNKMQDNKVKPLVEGKPNDNKRTYAQRNTEDFDKQHP
jgi:hypothetical protein